MESGINFQELKSFITSNFTSASQIEVLCFFRKNKPKTYSSDQVCSLLFLSDNFISQILLLLCERQFLIEKNHLYSFNGESIFESDGTLEALMDLYQNKNSQVLEILFSDSTVDI